MVKSRITQRPGSHLRGVKNTIAIASGKGGVGKSTVTVNLAATLAKDGARVGILDADIYGPSIPLMLGDTEGVFHDNERYQPAKAHGMQAMSMGYLTEGEPALIWRGPMLAKSLMHMINFTEWDDLDYLFIDLPPGTGDIQLSLVQKIPLTAAIVVSTPQSVATLDAEKAIKMFEKTGIHVLGLVENMATHTCSACGHKDAIFGQDGAQNLCQQFEIPLLGQLPLDRRIVELSDQGLPVITQKNDELCVPFKALADNAITLLEQRPINLA